MESGGAAITQMMSNSDPAPQNLRIRTYQLAARNGTEEEENPNPPASPAPRSSALPTKKDLLRSGQGQTSTLDHPPIHGQEMPIDQYLSDYNELGAQQQARQQGTQIPSLVQNPDRSLSQEASIENYDLEASQSEVQEAPGSYPK